MCYYIVPGKGGRTTLALVIENIIVAALYVYAEAAIKFRSVEKLWNLGGLR